MPISVLDYDATLVDALNDYVGTGKEWTRARFAAATGIPAKRLDRYTQGDQRPTSFDLLRMQAVLPPEFTNRILGLVGLGNARRIKPGNVTEFDVNKKAAAHAAAFAACLSDARSPGRIDEFEDRLLTRSAEELHATIGAHLATKNGAA